MKPSKDHKAQSDEGFLRAAYDLQADMALSAGADTSLCLARTNRKGVYEIVATATPNPKVWLESAGVQSYRSFWPRSEVLSLAAALFQAMHKLDLQVGEAIHEGHWALREPYE